MATDDGTVTDDEGADDGRTGGHGEKKEEDTSPGTEEAKEEDTSAGTGEAKEKDASGGTPALGTTMSKDYDWMDDDPEIDAIFN